MNPLRRIVLSFIALLALIVFGAILKARRRSRELSRLAPQLGFSFLGNAWHGPELNPKFRTCLIQRSMGRFSNVMVGTAGTLQACVFDYHERAGKGTVIQTLVCYWQTLQLPPFTLGPKGIVERTGHALFHNDIDFDSHPVFSRRYALKSPDEAGTRRLFTPGLLTYMEQLPADKHWILETNGTNLFVYRAGKTVAPADLSSFLHETSTIARTIFGSEGLKTTAS